MSGFGSSRSAAAPATSGVDMDVPLLKRYPFRRRLQLTIRDPGATISGLQMQASVGPRPESLDTLHCLSTGRQVVYRTPYSPKYPAAGDASLTDGLCGGGNYGDRRWQGGAR